MRTPAIVLTLATAGLLVSACSVTPVPLETGAVKVQIGQDMQSMFAEQEPLGDSIDFYTAVARAMRHNLDYRLKIMEEALASGAADVSRYTMLPTLTAGAGYHHRDNDSGATSLSLLTGTQSLEPSTSQERNRQTADLMMAWNVLDFGVSYAQTQQQANQVLVIHEQRRKVLQNIVQDVRSAWWKAVSAQELLPEMDDLLERVESALERSREMEKRRVQNPMDSLRYQQSLLRILQQMWGLRQDLSTAKSQLGALLNVRPGSFYSLDASPPEDPPGRIRTSVLELEDMALLGRPELREQHYKARIDSLGVRISMLRLFPGLELSVGHNNDSNKYLFNNTWTDAGLRMSWNIFNLFSGPAQVRQAEAQADVGEARRLALSMAVMTQVNLAYQRYHLALRNHLIATRQHEVESRIVSGMRAGEVASRQHELDVLRARASALAARMRLHVARAELQNSMGRLYNSLGLDPLPDAGQYADSASLASAVRETMASWSTMLAGNAQ